MYTCKYALVHIGICVIISAYTCSIDTIAYVYVHNLYESLQTRLQCVLLT
jgi:hypothetical protein